LSRPGYNVPPKFGVKSKSRCDRKTTFRRYKSVIIDDGPLIGQRITLSVYLFFAISRILKVPGTSRLKCDVIIANLSHFFVDNAGNLFVKIWDMHDPLADSSIGKMHIIECNLTSLPKLVLGFAMSNGQSEDWCSPFEKVLEFFHNLCGHVVR
jgi:hypothetical protein